MISRNVSIKYREVLSRFDRGQKVKKCILKFPSDHADEMGLDSSPGPVFPQP